MKGLYFIDRLNSFYLGSPDMVEAWKHLIQDQENKGKTVVAFTIPKEKENELLIAMEKLLTDKLR